VTFAHKLTQGEVMKKSSLIKYIALVIFALVVSCAGIQRGCSVTCAQEFGSDWIVVQYDMNMTPKCAWKLENVSIANEEGSDGIYWLDVSTGHLVHISGWYNRVQVTNNRFDEAAFLVGVDLNKIKNGKYEE
jgi:hypothetical protein